MTLFADVLGFLLLLTLVAVWLVVAAATLAALLEGRSLRRDSRRRNQAQRMR